MKAKTSNRFLLIECAIAFGTWLLVFLFLQFRQPDADINGYLALTGPYAIFFYWFCYAVLIPRARDFKMYLVRVILFIGITVIPIVAITGKLSTGKYLFAGIFSLIFQLVFTAPLTWEVFHYRLRKGKEIKRLKTALGKSHADYRFLQSQINPHFLFNALNTLLGTAMQEKAERTGEGIQMLGDMMRFMLDEQGKDFIPLTRELDYLQSFIALQRLRIGNATNITIETAIEEQDDPLEILPMLMIPFVENAFKHGISLRAPSHIRIALRTTGNILQFELSNTVHRRQINDPEKTSGGIGLANVKQRLKLVYPDKHELRIQESGNGFLVHLKLELRNIS